jgi:hypothetical protein
MSNNEELNLPLEEWKECRSSIDRFDTIIVDLRKYGFTLITGMLTADAFLFISLPEVSISGQIGISIMMMILVFALFVVDRYHEVFLLGAVERAIKLENDVLVQYELTTLIHTESITKKTDTSGTLLYLIFIICSAIPMLATNIGNQGLYNTLNDMLLPFLFLVLFLCMILLYHFITKPEKNPPRNKKKDTVITE